MCLFGVYNLGKAKLFGVRYFYGFKNLFSVRNFWAVEKGQQIIWGFENVRMIIWGPEELLKISTFVLKVKESPLEI